MSDEPSTSGRKLVTASPTQCLKCGHQFAPGAPEPSWCPDCGRLCSAYDVPDEPPGPDEIPETPQDKRRLWVWFWVMFLGGPVAAGVAALLAGKIAFWMPGALKPVAPTGAEPLLALFAGAGGAGFCLARMWYPRRSLRAQIVLAFALGCAVFLAYALVGVVIAAIIHILVDKILR